MTVFDAYGRYYDILYRDKDYDREARYVLDILKDSAPTAKRLLELGCGSGQHAQHFAHAGYHVAGVDVSEQMLAAAGALRDSLPGHTGQRLTFSLGDARTYRNGEIYDAVLALFHVASYQATNEDINAFLDTAYRHCKVGGLLLFDCWYGPAVLTERPDTRIKRLEDDQFAITRIAEPLLDTEQNIVDVQYEVHLREKQTGAVIVVRETHRMRYFFLPELHLLLNAHGFEPILTEEWLTGASPSRSTWGLFTAARKHV
jgi:SAM-dependent methyltransferase